MNTEEYFGATGHENDVARRRCADHVAHVAAGPLDLLLGLDAAAMRTRRVAPVQTHGSRTRLDHLVGQRRRAVVVEEDSSACWLALSIFIEIYLFAHL